MLHRHRRALAFTVTALSLALISVPGFAQDGGSTGRTRKPAKSTSTGGDKDSDLEKEIAEKIEKELDHRVEVTGKRWQIKLRRGSTIVGVLPRGVVWEKLDTYGDYVECKREDKGAGLRIQYVMGMDGEIFIKSDDIVVGEKGLKDLGTLTDEQKAKIRDEVLAARRRTITEREKAMRKELERHLAEQARKDAAEGKGADEAEAEPDDGLTKEERAGEALLDKFPFPEWSEDRKKQIEQREVVNSIYRNKEEAEFIDNFTDWKKALARRMLREADEGADESAK